MQFSGFFLSRGELSVVLAWMFLVLIFVRQAEVGFVDLRFGGWISFADFGDFGVWGVVFGVWRFG